VIDLTRISRDFPSWRPCPFRAGVSYRILHDFRSSDGLIGGNGASVSAGQILVFEFESWSRYDGATFYLFRNVSGEICVWNLGDEEDIDKWRQFFDEGKKNGDGFNI
jgi:hypothetical protein